MIPRIIHQSWKSKDIPAEHRGRVDSWRTLHPNWQYRLWTDEDNRRLVQDSYPWLLSTYDAYPLEIQRADMARILYVHRYGGLYVDLDFECFRPFDALSDNDRLFMGRENGGLGWYTRGQDFACNALLAAPPQHPFWISVLTLMVKRARPQHRWESRVAYVLATTGPKILDDVASDYMGVDLDIYPTEYFYPASVLEKNARRRSKLAVEAGAYAVHHASNSWFTQSMHYLMWVGYLLRGPARRARCVIPQLLK